MVSEAEPFGYVAHKNGYWAGVTCPGKGAGKFIASYINDGFTITTVQTREEYKALLDMLDHWHNSSEWKAEHAKKAATLPLFDGFDGAGS